MHAKSFIRIYYGTIDITNYCPESCIMELAS